MEIVMRKATLVDVPLLQELNQEVFVDNEQYDDDLMMDWATGDHGKKYFTNIVAGNKSFAFIAEVDGKPVGYIACSPKVRPWRKSTCIEIDNMGVNPAYRSKGIGSRLIEKVKEEIKKEGIQRLFVSSYFHNKKAVDFYKRHGLQEIDLALEMEI